MTVTDNIARNQQNMISYQVHLCAHVARLRMQHCISVMNLISPKVLFATDNSLQLHLADKQLFYFTRKSQSVPQDCYLQREATQLTLQIVNEPLESYSSNLGIGCV